MLDTLKKILNNTGTYDIQKILRRIEGYRYVSFDIFDTLIKRDVPSPKEVFRAIERKYKIDGFTIHRIEAEKEARRRAHSEEVTLQEIYQCFPENNSQRYASLEIEMERTICTRNEVLYQVYTKCIEMGITVVLTTDMYLPKEVIETILLDAGIHSYYRLFVSNAVKKTKTTGSLYAHLLAELGIKPDEIIHIGDSFRSDYIMAIGKGVKSVKIPRVVNNCLFHNSMRSLQNKYLESFISNHVLVTKENYYARFGYECLGPLLFGFVSWMYEDAKRNGIERFYFLSRDGYIIKQAYEVMGYQTDIPCNYLEVSRRSLRIPYFIGVDSLEELANELIVPYYTTIKEALNALGLNFEAKKTIIEECGLDCDTIYKWDALKESTSFISLLNKLSEDVHQNAMMEINAFEKYLRQFDFKGKIAIVDIGWRGSIQKYLSVCLERFKCESDIMGYYVGLSHESIENLGRSNYKAKGYLFDCYNNPNDVSDNQAYAGLLESIFLEPIGSVEKYILLNDQCLIQRQRYEYDEEGEIKQRVETIQKNAIRFIDDMARSSIQNLVKEADKSIFEDRIFSVLKRPSNFDVMRFGDMPFYNNGIRNELAAPKSIWAYLLHPDKLFLDFGKSKWKTGFLKVLLKFPFNYYSIIRLMLKRRQCH